MSGARLPTMIGGIYLIVFGLLLALVPNNILPIFGFAPPADVWIRVVGTLTTVIGYLGATGARNNDLALMRAGVATRAFVVVSFAILVATGLAQPQLLLFAAIELIIGLWTFMSLRTTP